jgi:GYF domain 2
MQYFVKRAEEKFGPYTLAELQRYAQSGNITADDLAQSEGMTDWAPVSQVLGNIPATAVASFGSAEAAEPAPQLVSLAPNLHWVFVLILDIVTRQLFNLIWSLILANWARKLSNNNKPLVLVAMYPAGIITGMLVIMTERSMAPLGSFFILAGLIVYVVGIFSIKAAMEEYYNWTEKIGLRMSSVMTFFFSTIYIQYHINRIARWKKTGVLS